MCYFLFSVLHAVAQVSLQVHAFSINARAANFLWNIVQESDSATEGFTVLKEGLWECNSIPSSLSVSSCNVIWSGAPANDTQYTMSNVVEVSNSFSLESLSSFTVTSTSASSPSETKIPADNSILADGSYTTVTVTVPPSSTSSHAVPKSTSISVVPRSASRTASIPREVSFAVIGKSTLLLKNSSISANLIPTYLTALERLKSMCPDLGLPGT